MTTRYNIWRGGGKTTLVPADGGALVAASDFDAALDALQEMCRRHCAWRCGHYDPMGSQVAHDALDVLVQAGRLAWIGDESLGRRRCAKDKEAQG